MKEQTSKSDNLNVVFTVDDIMDMLNVKRVTVHEWIKRGKIKAVKIGKQWRIPKEYYDEFILLNTVDNSKKEK